MAFPVYFDEDSMRASVLRALREFSWDCLSVIEAHNEALSDEHQLTWATNHGRCVFTSNQRDFARLHREWARAGREHGGIIILTDQRALPQTIVGAMESVGMAFSADSIRNQCLFLNNWRSEGD